MPGLNGLMGYDFFASPVVCFDVRGSRCDKVNSMWKLFPNSWLRRMNVIENRHSADVAALEERWQDWLDAALSSLKRAAPSNGGNRTQRLQALTGSDLLALDSRIRTVIFYSAKDAPPGSTPEQEDDDSQTDAYLLVASCHPNGFVRERALIAFRHRGGALALAAGLIHSTDWVPEVRDAAISMVEDIVPRLPPAEVVRYLDLAVSLTGRLRVSERLWQRSISPKLTAAQSRDALWAATQDLKNSRVLRHAAFEFLLLGEDASRFEILQRAVVDRDPVVSRWAFDRSAGILPPDQHSVLVRAAFQHAHASVRQRALREYLTSNLADSAEVLRTALLDSSRGVRAVAVFELGRRFGESPLPIWRAALRSPSRQQLQAATLALCEAGEREDVDGLSEGSTAQNVDVRAALLRALERVDSTRLRQRLEAAVRDESNVVLRQAAQIYRRNALPLHPTLLEEALGRASARSVPGVMALTSALGRWDALELLLRHASGEDGIRAACAAESINAWCGDSRKGLTPAPADQTARLEELFLAAQARHRDRSWQLLEFILRTRP